MARNEGTRAAIDSIRTKFGRLMRRRSRAEAAPLAEPAPPSLEPETESRSSTHSAAKTKQPDLNKLARSYQVEPRPDSDEEK